jgi:L-phenylalanine/L-methionine N-acetyltransferase
VSALEAVRSNRGCLTSKTLEGSRLTGVFHMDEQKIVIRRQEPEDFLGLQRILAQPRAIWGTLQVPYPSAQAWRKRLAEQAENVYALVACVNQEIVGSLGLFANDRSARRRHVGQLGMAVHDQWQGQGIGTALMNAAIDLADRWLNLNRLELTVYTDNEPAIRLYKRFAFEIEGRLRKYSFRDGVFVDAYAMARVR